jgi:predicted alpha/beta superfamily hydrolase
MTMRRATLAVLALALATVGAAPALAEPLKIVSDSPPMPSSYSRFALHSDRLGRDISVTVNMPGATAFLPGQKLPVIYALDGGYGMAGPQGNLLANTGNMQPAIIVSVGYLAGQKNWRSTDLTHTKGSIPESGGGAAFEAFLIEDLKPFIEAKFPADPKHSVLFGHSLGGLFAANVFADNPDAFSGYIIGSASAWADPPVVDRVAAAAGRAHGTRVYLTVSELEYGGTGGGVMTMGGGYEALGKALSGKPGVTLQNRLYTGESHLSYYPRLVNDGFPAVLPPAVPLSAQQAKAPPEAARYTGVYDLPDGRKVTVKMMPSGQLGAALGGVIPVPLLSNGPDRFYSPQTDVAVSFDEKSATLSGGGISLRIPREAAAKP